MPSRPPVAERVFDTIPRIDDAVSVGEDLEFQYRWWRFEKAAWILLTLILLGDVLGVFGRGWLAQAKQSSSDGMLQVQYERVERAGTPSEMTILIAPGAIHEKRVKLFASQSVVRQLGAQRIIPEPLTSEIGPRGITYTFPVTGGPATISIALEPSFPGIHPVELSVAGSPSVQYRIVVLP